MTVAVRVDASCCIAGGGPAGMMLGYLLARAGVDVVVLEKHADFLRDFRGDTIHPSTLEVMHELGLLDEFLRRPHQEVERLGSTFGGEHAYIADFSHLPVQCPYIAMMPQWDFLDFLAQQANSYPNFRLVREAEVVDLVFEAERVIGVVAETPQGRKEFRANLAIGADGRGSIVRERAGLVIEDLGAPMDVLWLRIPRVENDPAETMGRFDSGHIFVMIERGDYWQCAFVIPKGGFDAVRELGLPAFRQQVARLAPFLADRVQLLESWDDVKLLVVKVDRLRQWHRQGLLCIGDAAHAMSPIGGVGINLAIQDAVAAANILAPALLNNMVSDNVLAKVQHRRLFPTRVTQRLQVLAQNRIIGKVLQKRESNSMRMPAIIRLMQRFSGLQRIPARLVGMGIRPEHVDMRWRSRE